MIIDCDSHMMPLATFEHVPPALRARAPRLVLDDRARMRDLDFPGQPAPVAGATPVAPADAAIGTEYAGNIDPEARLADNARMRVDRQFLLPQATGWWSYLLPADLAAALAHSWNVAAHKLMRDYPGRFEAVALVPLQDVRSAVTELEWAAHNGLRAAMLDYVYPVAAHPYGTPLGSHRELWPLFARAEALGMPLFLHAVQHGHRLLNLPCFHAAGAYVCAPSDADVNLASLIGSGLLDDFPRLQLVHAETGSTGLVALAARLDARFDGRSGDGPIELFPATLRPARNRLPPSEYFRRNFYWTIETEDPELGDAVTEFGAERFLFATDYPHSDAGGLMKFEDAARLDSLPSLSAAAKDLIRSGNAARLFRLG